MLRSRCRVRCGVAIGGRGSGRAGTVCIIRAGYERSTLSIFNTLVCLGQTGHTHPRSNLGCKPGVRAPLTRNVILTRRFLRRRPPVGSLTGMHPGACRIVGVLTRRSVARCWAAPGRRNPCPNWGLGRPIFGHRDSEVFFLQLASFFGNIAGWSVRVGFRVQGRGAMRI